MTTSWFSESSPDRPTWEAVTGAGPDALAEAARVGPTLGKAGRRWWDYALTGVFSITLVAGASGLLPLLLVTGLAWLIQVRRSRVLDRRDWELAAPTYGARRFRTVEVAEPAELAPGYGSYRWWAVVDEDGTPVYGLFGAQTRWYAERKVCILPCDGSSPGSIHPVPVPGFWTATAQFQGDPAERGYTVLHVQRANGLPQLAVRVPDPSQRDVLELLAYPPDLPEDEAVAVLSSLAIVRKKLRPGPITPDLPSVRAVAATRAPGNAPVAAVRGVPTGQPVVQDRGPARWPTGSDYGQAR